MSPPIRCIGIALGGGFVPGLADAVHALAQAAQARGWQVKGIRDGFDGLLCPQRYPAGGVVELDAAGLARLQARASLLGTGARCDPFRLQQQGADGMLVEVDAAPRLLAELAGHGIDAVVGIVGGSAVTGAHALGVMWKLGRLGLPCVCIAKSAENDLAATRHPLGYHSVVQYTAETLWRIANAARDVGRVALIEVPGQLAGWLALEAGLAAGADALLIPEIAFDVERLALHLDSREAATLVVVAEGASAAASSAEDDAPGETLRARLAPLADPAYGSGARVIHRAGRLVQTLHQQLQRNCARELLPMSLEHLVRIGPTSPTDRALAQAYGQAAIAALADGATQHLIASAADPLQRVALDAALNRVQTLPADAPLLRRARELGVFLGNQP